MSDWKNVQYKDGKYRTGEGGGGGSSTFAGLDDVSFSNLQNGQIPKYNSTTQKWENANESGGGGTVTDVEVDGVSVVNQQGVAEITTPKADGITYDNQQSGLSATDVQGAIDELAQSGGVDALSDLSDVQLNNLIDHQPLRYDATLQKWRNGADSFPPLIYSDEEREIGVWKDGKPLYQVTLSSTSTVKNESVNIDLTDYDIDTLVNAEGRFNRFVNSLEFWYDFDYYYNGTYHGMLQYNKTESRMETFVNLATNDTTNYRFFTIQYTKNSDVAGSGKYTTYGGLTHHYSTTEQVVGTWVNGKPVYEKTWYDLNITVNASDTQIADVTDLDVKDIVYIDLFGTYGVATGSLVAVNASQVSLNPVTHKITAYRLRSGVTAQILIARYTKTTD